MDKDSIVRKVTDNISPMPVGIKVHPVEFPGDKWVYIILGSREHFEASPV